MRKLLVLRAITLGAVVLGVPAFGSSIGAADQPIRLKAITFEPLRGEPALAPGLRHRALTPDERGTYIVQFVGPIEDASKAAVMAAGGELLEYVPEFAFKARMSPEQAAVVRGLPSVRWVGFFHPAYKLSPRLTRAGERLYVLLLEPGSDSALVATAIRAAGAKVLKGEGRTVIVLAATGQLEVLATIEDVAWIENFLLHEKHNDKGGGVIMAAATANASGYDGSTQTVAIADTGIGGGTAATAHAHIAASRVAAIRDWPGVTDICFEAIVSDGPRDVDTGHGTHVAVSALGTGGATGLGKGTAPAARLFFQSVENYVTTSALCQALGLPPGYYLTGIPADLRQLFQQAYDSGARVHSNSWGSAAAGEYTTDSVNADQFVWSHRDMTVTFSAGNEGVDANSDGGVDGDSMASPATAKNVISVGASENDRSSDYPCDATKSAVCAFQGGQNGIFTWGEQWPFEFPENPLHSDPSAGNAEQMAAFSSRGPTDDGRIKPDVVAPGTWVLSGFSDLYQEAYDPSPNPQDGLFQYDGWGFPLNDKLKYLGGTSMANPLVAGGAAVVRDFYQELHSHTASAALVKATLVNSAQDLLDENNDGFDDNDLAIPNFYEGWGRVDLAAATDGSREFVDQATGLSTGGASSFVYDVAAGTPFKVTLVWSDYSGNPAAAKMLVNNLNLEVSGPGGASYRGNVFGGGWSIAGGVADNTNNVENVYLQTPAAGAWTVTVRGFNVPQGPQPFALVVAGQLSSPPPPPSPQPVVWTAAVGVSVSANTLTKTAAIGWGNAGAVSSQQISGDGYVEVTASATSGYRMFGLSNGNSTTHYQDIDFAVCECGSAIRVYEAGVLKGTFGTFATGDRLRVAVLGTTVAYSRNGILFYTSTAAPTRPLLVDAALYTTYTTISSAVISGGSTPPPPPPGSPVPVVWTALAGVSVAGNSLTKTAAIGWGNSGAVSSQQISGDGYVEVTASATSGYRMFGLSNGNSSTHYQDIDFAVCECGSEIRVYEAGVLEGTFGAFAAGNGLRVAVVGNTVTYSRNGAVFYTSTATPTRPLLVDAALYTTSTTISNALVSGAP